MTIVESLQVQVAVDIAGTFTDLVVADSRRDVVLVKVPCEPTNPAAAVPSPRPGSS